MKLNNKGFSLVELMVVVAIIGILATIAVPQVQKFMAKAKTSEATTQLNAIYSAEKSFYVNWQAYHTAFQAIGYAPEGRLTYDVGFRTAGATSNDYTVQIPAGVNVNAISAGTYCAPALNAAPVVAGATCALKQEAGLAAVAAGGIPAATAGVNNSTTYVAAGAQLPTFQAAAVSRLFKGAVNVDTWTINQLNQTNHPTDGSQ